MNMNFSMSSSALNSGRLSSVILHVNKCLLLFQASLDKMAKGHMLADVVAIIGKIVQIIQNLF